MNILIIGNKYGRVRFVCVSILRESIFKAMVIQVLMDNIERLIGIKQGMTQQHPG